MRRVGDVVGATAGGAGVGEWEGEEGCGGVRGRGMEVSGRSVGRSVEVVVNGGDGEEEGLHGAGGEHGGREDGAGDDGGGRWGLG